jgi:hypothetical protein
MPRQAVALKKYRCGTSPVSKISDSEDATPALGYSEVLSVQDSVGPPIPEFFQAPEEGSKVPSSARRQDSGHILPHHPAGACAASKSKKLKGQVATVVIQSTSESGDGEGLTGGSAHENID